MSEYKRLTNEELEDFVSRVVVQLEPTLTQQVLSLVLELEQYRYKIEQGTLIELPCKVGDKAWYLVTQPTLYLSRNTIYSGVITRIYITKKDLHCAIQIRNDKGVTEIPIIINTKENLFFTKAEAEARLKELKGEV